MDLPAVWSAGMGKDGSAGADILGPCGNHVGTFTLRTAPQGARSEIPVRILCASCAERRQILQTSSAGSSHDTLCASYAERKLILQSSCAGSSDDTIYMPCECLWLCDSCEHSVRNVT